jgi:hypothetical protein
MTLKLTVRQSANITSVLVFTGRVKTLLLQEAARI